MILQVYVYVYRCMGDRGFIKVRAFLVSVHQLGKEQKELLLGIQRCCDKQ